MRIPADKGATLFMFIGVFATIGRLGGGFLCNLKWIKARVLVQAESIFLSRVEGRGFQVEGEGSMSRVEGRG